ncbi:MAG: hypothetical protein ACKVI3_17710 [Verrucomicrobiia bacterium]|tara:strand:- start:5351 stop:5995 length:645 start_codon:yes stop_codon:yes gene_type:complete
MPSSFSSPTGAKRRTGLILCLLGLVVLGLFYFRSSTDLDPPVTHKPVSDDSLTNSAPPETPSDPPLSAESITEPALATLLDEYMVPGRMVFFQIQLSRDGTVLLQQAQGAVGRAKPAPIRNAPGFVRIDSFNQNGELTFSQTVEDPTHRIIEHPASSNDGRIATTIDRREVGNLFVRVAGESLASQLVLSRWTITGNDSAPTWNRFATITLPKS